MKPRFINQGEVGYLRSVNHRLLDALRETDGSIGSCGLIGQQNDETLVGLGEIDGSEVEEGPEDYDYEDWQAQWDDDPNPYHGTYSED